MSDFDVTALHEHLDAAEAEFKKLFKGHVPDEHFRFGAFLSKVRMVADQSSDRSGKGD